MGINQEQIYRDSPVCEESELRPGVRFPAETRVSYVLQRPKRF